MAFIENTGLERLWGHIVHRLSQKADKEDLKILSKTVDEIPQADWNQNDETAKDYIKNRPFYSFQNVVEVINGTYTTSAIGRVNFGTNIALDANIGDDISLIVNGDEYIYQLKQNKSNGSFRYAGNGYFNSNSTGVTEDSGEPFLLVHLTSGNIKMLQLYTSYTEATQIDVSIAYKTTTYIQIDSRYMNEKPGVKTDISGAEIFNDYITNIASGEYSHAEGSKTTASGNCSHAEGSGTDATGTYSHAEGYGPTASGYTSHAEGYNTIASGEDSHAEGYCTTASGNKQHVQGSHNINDVDAEGNALNTYLHIVGNGADDNNPSNAHTLDWNGNAWFSGDVYVGSTSGTNMDEGSKKLITASEIPQSDWSQIDETAPDYIKNRTHYEKITYSDTLTWDGNTEGLKDYNDDSLLPKCRISNVAPTLEQLQNGVRVVEKYFDGTVYQDNLIPFNQMLYHEDANVVLLYGNEIQLEDNHYTYEIDGVQYEGVIEKGVYFVKDVEFGTYTAELQIPGFTGFETVEIVQLDPKYIPSPSDEEMLELLMEMDMVDPATNSAGSIYADNNGKVYTL